jgi:hypothetical protein
LVSLLVNDVADGSVVQWASEMVQPSVEMTENYKAGVRAVLMVHLAVDVKVKRMEIDLDD